MARVIHIRLRTNDDMLVGESRGRGVGREHPLAVMAGGGAAAAAAAARRDEPGGEASMPVQAKDTCWFGACRGQCCLELGFALYV